MNAVAFRVDSPGPFSMRERRIVTPAETPIIASVVTSEATPEVWCEATFIDLAESEPSKLLRWIQSDLSTHPALLTFAAEAAGRIRFTPWVVSVLLPLLRHENPVVREGAIYGLTPHLRASIEARNALRELLQTDPSPGVREALEESLASVD